MDTETNRGLPTRKQTAITGAESSAFPSALRNASHEMADPALHTIGDPALLHSPLLALFSSVRCGGDAIVRSYDLVRELRDAGVGVIGGFHSPMEKECLTLLLRGRQPIVVCPARSIEAMRVPSAWRPAIDAGRLLVVSAFEPGHRRVTADLAETRNRLVATLAQAVLVTCVARGSKIERLCRDLVAEGKTVIVADNASAAVLGLQAPGTGPTTIDVIRAAVAR